VEDIPNLPNLLRVGDLSLTDLLCVEDLTELLRVEYLTDLLHVEDITDLLRKEDLTDLFRVEDLTDLLRVEDPDAGETAGRDSSAEVVLPQVSYVIRCSGNTVLSINPLIASSLILLWSIRLLRTVICKVCLPTNC
jgi:hypothetical protein